jgi:hypothetical protein
VAAQLPAEQWQRYRLLEGSKGPLVADFAAFRAVAVRHRLPGPEVWVLLRRTIPSPGEQPVYKYYLSQAPAETPLAELVRVSGMRWPIEACFEEGKEEVGLDQYELRFWRGWHHHMTLVILAHHFLVRLQRRLDQRGGGTNSNQPLRSRRPHCASAVQSSAWTGSLHWTFHTGYPQPSSCCPACPKCTNSCAPSSRCPASTCGPPSPSWPTSSSTTPPPTFPTASAPCSA